MRPQAVREVLQHIDDDLIVDRYPPVLTRPELDFLTHNRVIKELGRGTYGVVYLVEFHYGVAVLKLANGNIPMNMFVREYEMMEAVWGAGGCPFPLAISYYPPALLAEFVGSHTLEQVLSQENSDEYLASLALAVCVAVQELHEKNIVHNDLKEDNLIVDNECRVHVIDLGCACRPGESVGYLSDDETTPWLAPEVMGAAGVSTFDSDCYSVGYLLDLIQSEMKDKMFF